MASVKRQDKSEQSECTGNQIGSNDAVSQAASASGCCDEHDELPRIVDFGFDPIDVFIINLVRSVCSGYASGENCHWDAACASAERDVGAIDGPSFVARTICLMRAVQRERTGGFGFMMPGCPNIAEHELVLIALIRAARQRNSLNFTAALRELASVPEPARIANAATALAALCIRHAALQADPSRDATKMVLN